MQWILWLVYVPLTVIYLSHLNNANILQFLKEEYIEYMDNYVKITTII